VKEVSIASTNSSKRQDTKTPSTRQEFYRLGLSAMLQCLISYSFIILAGAWRLCVLAFRLLIGMKVEVDSA
jgi:hypothetical protein